MMRQFTTRFLQALAAVLLLSLLLVVISFCWLMYRYDFSLLGVITGSMVPAINTNDAIISQPAKPSSLQSGDIVTYRTQQGALVTHRIATIDQPASKITTKGDANRATDSPITFDQIVSQPVAVVPFGGWVIALTKKPVVFLGLSYSLLVGLIVREIGRLLRNTRPAYRAPGY